MADAEKKKRVQAPRKTFAGIVLRDADGNIVPKSGWNGLTPSVTFVTNNASDIVEAMSDPEVATNTHVMQVPKQGASE